ncbi:unnamed protein product [Danaus chrysippus]|uniref:(African queen) hypothetical protein n=1 Tax=Danaus chrysippus TaxID=151541 RepID=A0A8J2W5D2_9NEOP|nr:unnamed protein product [Danaus chrysippus]
MWNDIDQIKAKIDEVFDAVLNSNASKIDEFLLVTFNDPDAKVYKATRDRKEFKKALSDITVDGGGDCPEYSMKGIQLALEHSKPNSLFYVFTDAAAKDYKEYEKIKSLGLKKSIQVTFLLTGECDDIPKEASTVYDNLAETTSGQVFHIDKEDVSKFSIDSKLWDIMISVSSELATFYFTGPDGKLVDVKDFISTEKSSILKLDVKPGIYKMVLDDFGQTSVVITGSTSVSFQHGFSTVMPSTLNETSTKPIKDTPSYLAIELDNVDKDVILDTVEIRDIDDDILSAYPLQLLNKHNQFYVTKPILTPHSTFKIAINGHTNTKEKITRMAPTAIEHQKPDLEGPNRTPPMVIILEGGSTTVDYDSNLSLKCKVHGFPKSHIVWIDDSLTIWPSKVVPVDLPYIYMSILDIDKINKNITLYCIAKNEIGEDKKTILVETKKKYFLDILESPEDLVIEYGSSSVLNFKVKSYPPATIKWFKETKELFNDGDYEISSDGSTLKIKYMFQTLSGLYSAKAMNEEENKIIHFKIDMSGEGPNRTAPVVIILEGGSTTVDYDSNLSLKCKVHGFPKSNIVWKDDSGRIWPSKVVPADLPYEYMSILDIHKMNKNITLYCTAKNEIGEDKKTILVETKKKYFLDILESPKDLVIEYGSSSVLNFKVKSYPPATIKWFKKTKELFNDGDYEISSDGSTLKIKYMYQTLSGLYSAKAMNEEENKIIHFKIDMSGEGPNRTAPVAIILEGGSTTVDYDSNLSLKCKVHGFPKSNIVWKDDSGRIWPSKRKMKSVKIKKTILVETKKKYFLDILESPKDLVIEYGSSSVLNFKVKSYPPATIKWFKKTKELFNDGDYEISSDGSTLKIKYMYQTLSGLYSAKAMNEEENKIIHFKIDMSGEKPEINKTVSSYNIEEGSSVNLTCRMVRGKPEPEISWGFQNESPGFAKRLDVVGDLYIDKVGPENMGIYTCKARNEFGNDYHYIDLFVGYVPTIKDVKTEVLVPEGQQVILTCIVDGSPYPFVRWLRNDVEVTRKGKYSFNYNALSLTFVIDDTGSMSDDIDQVKARTNEVFDAVLNSNASKIDEFLLVTFNDPDAKVYKATRDRKEFKKALYGITVDGGGDCPEYSMKGIQLALEHSKPNSLFYVFTDAAAKDYKEYEKIKSLALKKSIQVTFLLTGECDDTPKEAFTVYDNLAETTSGQVFHLDKQDVSKFSIDSKLWDVMISVSADAPKYHINGPDGELVDVKDFISTEKSSISKLDVKPGLYTMVLDNVGQTSVVITGSTSVCFQHGFSTVMPSTLNETSTKPIEDTTSYLAIELDNVARDVILDTVEIRDIDDNILSAYPLELLNKDNQFYITKPILTPDSTFKIAINGHTSTKEKITRIATTAIEHQKPELEGPNRIPPMVIILEGGSTAVEYESNLSLKCKVHGFPKSDIVWKDDSGKIWPSKVIPVDLPYEYMSILDIDKINKNITLYCTAKNEIGEDKKFIAVETKRNYFLEILESPKDLVIEYGSSNVLNFKVNAYPPATIKWFKKTKELFNDADYEISSDGSALKIKHMHQGLRGFYSVKAMNEEEKKIIHFKIDMSGEKPEIDKTVSSYNIEKGSSLNLTCRIVRGKPEPEIFWTFQNESPGFAKRLDVIGDLYIDKVGPENMGIYTCKARNEFGKDSHDIDLFVGYVPTIKDVKTEVLVPEGQQVILTCIVDGSPYPFVRWLRNDVEVTRKGKYSFNDNTLSFTGSLEDSGVYTCEASNILGQTQKDYDVQIYMPVKMQVPKDTTLKLDVGSSTTLQCRADGYPKPNMTWTFYRKNSNSRPRTLKFEDTGSYNLEHVQIEDEGYYRCSASNVGGLSSVTYKVLVRAPVSITNPDGVVYNVVKGDLALRIPCNAIGSPKPKITWKANGEQIASASPAQPEVVTDTVILEIGNSTDLECDLPHKTGDIVNWYKDGELIARDKLYLNQVSLKDAGVYSCRVSTFLSAHTAHKKVTVGYKPRFLSDEETIIEYSEGDFSYMNCEADGYPNPSTQWTRNGEPIPTNTSYVVVEMKPEDIGYYQCTVRNELGAISRTFKINSGECLLRTKYDFNDQQPLLLTLSRDWPEFKTSKEHVHIPIYKDFLLTCPGSSIIYDGQTFGQNVKTKCSIEKDKIEIRNRIIDYDKLKCAEKIKPLAKRTGMSCFEQYRKNTELLQIGFTSRSKFLKVYEVCLDYEQRIPVFAKQILNKGIALNAPSGDYAFVESKFLPFHFGDMYDCDSQLRFISSSIGKSIKSDFKDPECCFTKRHLINPRDVLPGLSQVAVYSYLNVIPHWSTCGTKNWDELELRVRYLAKYSYYEHTVFTGASDPMMLPGQTKDAYVSLRDRLNRRQPVPMYLWKIVQNPADNSSLAVIQLNIPNLTSAEAYSYMPCNDICSEVDWLRNNDWQDVNKGFTFCCSISDFNSRFGTLFEGYEKVFKSLPPLVPEFSLI